MTGPPRRTADGAGRVVIRPLRDFLAKEAASGILHVDATIVALVWANSP